MAIIMAVAAVTFGLYAGKGATSAAMRFAKMEPAEFDMREQLKYGLFNHLYLSSAQPVLYDSMIAGNSTRILDYAKSQPISGSHNLQAPPNVVVILAESLMDPKTLATEFRNDPLAGLRADGAENRAEGLARVHVVGGRSWISEFTLLTGIPSLLLGSNSLWPFDLASSDTWTLARALKGQGYKTYALYAPRGDFLYNARETYLRLGFDKFLDVEDFNIWFGDMDASADEKLLKAADQILRDEPGPVFIFAVSFDLHMPYDSIGNGRFVDRSVGTPGMQEFFRRESIFAAQLTQFLEKQDQGASQLLFGIVGDHIPPMPRAFEEIGFREDVEAPLYRTHYLLHSSHAPLNAAATGMDMDLSFFASLILDSAGLDGGQYFRVNSAVRELCRGRFVLCDAPSDLLQSYYAYLGANLTVAAPQ
jgi:phosphoglycerol transferase MdoB-like AlkP superfamily enzyme